MNSLDSAQINFDLPPDLKAEAQAAARAADLSLSQWLRLAVRNQLNKEPS